MAGINAKSVKHLVHGRTFVYCIIIIDALQKKKKIKATHTVP